MSYLYLRCGFYHPSSVVTFLFSASSRSHLQGLMRRSQRYFVERYGLEAKIFQQGCWNLQSRVMVAYYNHCICTLTKSLMFALLFSADSRAVAHRRGRLENLPVSRECSIPLEVFFHWQSESSLSLPCYCCDIVNFPAKRKADLRRDLVPFPNQMELDVSCLYIFTGTHFDIPYSENVINKYIMNVLSPKRSFRNRTFQDLKHP